MTDIRRNALDTALIKFNQAQKYLELPSPGKKDFEQARDHAKDGLDLVKACLVALDHDCFEIMDRPPVKPEPGPGLFTPTGAPSPEAEVPSDLPALGCIDVDLVPTPEPFPEGDKDEQKDAFDCRVTALEELFCDYEEAAGRDDYQAQLVAFRPHRKAWATAWKIDPPSAWLRLQTTLGNASETKLGETFAAWS